jgi:hypothetical protein
MRSISRNEERSRGAYEQYVIETEPTKRRRKWMHFKRITSVEFLQRCRKSHFLGHKLVKTNLVTLTRTLMDSQLIHNIRNRLYLVTLLLGKIKNENATVEKIQHIIKSIGLDCLQLNNSHVDTLININADIKHISSHFEGLECKLVFQNELEFIGSKSLFCDVIINILKNSQEAGATKVKFEIECRTLVISDNGKCVLLALDKLNNGDAFTTKDTGNGLGTQAIRQFSEENKCKLTYSMPNNSMSIEIIFP